MSNFYAKTRFWALELFAKTFNDEKLLNSFNNSSIMDLKGPKYVYRIVAILVDSGENCPVRYHSSGNKNIWQVAFIDK